jgi:tetratricopeptide (TPR) repeat protein
MTPPSSADATGPGIRRAIDAALACHLADRFEEAARIFGDVLPRIVSPELPAAWVFYGEALRRIGRLEEAAAALTKAVTLAPEDWLTWGNLGGVYFFLDRQEKARDCLLRATQLHEDADLWSKLGVVERRLGQSEAAIQCYQRAIATDPNYPAAWRNLGNVWRDALAWDDAIVCYERLVELRPDNARDWVDLGVAYAGAKKGSEARRAFVRALAIDPAQVNATYNLALWHLLEKDTVRTRAWYRYLKRLSLASAREFAELVTRATGTPVEVADGYLSAVRSDARRRVGRHGECRDTHLAHDLTMVITGHGGKPARRR